MALDKAYFDAISIDVARKKYYNVNKVEAVLTDIRREAELLNDENDRLRRELLQVQGEGETEEILSAARSIARRIIADANDRADGIIREAEEQSRELLSRAAQREDRAAQKVQAVFEKLREQQLAAAMQLNADYQAFLCGFYDEDGEADPVEADAAELSSPLEKPEDLEDGEELSPLPHGVPADLTAKVGAIASEMFAIGKN